MSSSQDDVNPNKKLSSTTIANTTQTLLEHSLPPTSFSLNDYIKHTYGSMSGSGGSHGNLTSLDHTTSTPTAATAAAFVDDPTPPNNEHRSLLVSFDENTVSTSSDNGGGGAGGGNIINQNCTSSDSTSNEYTLRRLALDLSLYLNLLITLTKLIAYIQTQSLSVLAAFLDSVLDVVSQAVLNYTEKHSGMQRSSAFYPAGASRLEPIGVLTCAALMGMASFEVLKESCETLMKQTSPLIGVSLEQEVYSFWSMVAIIVVKLLLLGLCQRASIVRRNFGSSKASMQFADPTLEALAQDHWNDVLSNSVAAIALLFALYSPSLWWFDPVGAIGISIYIIYSWYHTGKEQIEQLTGKSAPTEFIEELLELATNFDHKILTVDTIRAYHFGPKFLVELEIVMPQHTLLKESHDLGMELQYEIEAREEVERCFVHIDYETRDYDEHVVSKVPELREQLLRRRQYKSHCSV